MMNIVIPITIFIVLFSFLYLQVKVLRLWMGWWRLVAALPALALLLVAFNIIAGILYDRTAHNLWPLEIVAWSAGGLVYLGILFVIRKLTVKR
jgi:hypothetical protein